MGTRDGGVHPLSGCVTLGFWLVLLAIAVLGALQHFEAIPRW